MLADRIGGTLETRPDQVTLAIDQPAELALGIPSGLARPAGPTAEALIERLEENWPRPSKWQFYWAAPPGGTAPDYPRIQAATERFTHTGPTPTTGGGRSSAPTGTTPVRQPHQRPASALMRQELEHVRRDDLHWGPSRRLRRTISQQRLCAWRRTVVVVADDVNGGAGESSPACPVT